MWIHTKYEAAEYLLFHRTKAVLTFAATWCSPPLDVLRCSFGVPGCGKYVIFRRLVHGLAAMDTPKLRRLCHHSILFQGEAQKQRKCLGIDPAPTAIPTTGTKFRTLSLNQLRVSVLLKEHFSRRRNSAFIQISKSNSMAANCSPGSWRAFHSPLPIINEHKES